MKAHLFLQFDKGDYVGARVEVIACQTVEWNWDWDLPFLG